MNILDIDRLNDIAVNDYITDRAGSILSNGSICAVNIYPDKVKEENGFAVVDLSSCRPRRYGDYDFCLEDPKSKMTIYHIEPKFAIIEYFNVDGHIMPFMHQYNYITHRFCFARGAEKYVTKMNVRDFSKILIRYPNKYSYVDIAERLKSHLQCQNAEAYMKESYDEFAITDFKQWQFISKTLRGIAERERWRFKYGEFPKLFLEVNDSSKNRYSYDDLIQGISYYDEFYGKNYEGRRRLEIYCKHPRKDHREYFYKFEEKGDK